MQRILVVEDDLDIQELLKNFLQETGYEISLAGDGVEALSLFSASRFDLVLLDVMLPRTDGFAVCELIRKQSQVPVIMQNDSLQKLRSGLQQLYGHGGRNRL